MVLRIGPSGLMMIAKERMQTDQRDRAQWLAVQRVKESKWEEDRLKRLFHVTLLSDDLKGQIIRAAAWNVLSGQSLTLVQLKRSVSDPQAIQVLQGLAEHDWIELDDTGSRVRGVGGITLVPTCWRLNLWAPVYARSLNFALEWFRALAENGRIEGNCPRCQGRLVISILNGKVRDVRPKRHRTGCLVNSLVSTSPEWSLSKPND